MLIRFVWYRSVNTDCEVQTLQEVFKSHSSHLTRILNQATNKMLQASEQNNEDSKLLQLSIASVRDHLLESNKYIVEAITDIKEEEATRTERLFNIAASMQVVSWSLLVIRGYGVLWRRENGLGLYDFWYAEYRGTEHTTERQCSVTIWNTAGVSFCFLFLQILYCAYFICSFTTPGQEMY